MTALIDPIAIGDALIAQIATGTFDGDPIAAAWRDPSGLLSPPCVVVVPPSLGFEGLGEGWELPQSTWTLQLYTDGGGLGPDAQQDVQLAFAMLEALRADPSLGGVVDCVVPIEAPEPIVHTSGTESAPRRSYLRSLRITIDH